MLGRLARVALNDGRPEIEVTLHAHRRQTARGVSCFAEAFGDSLGSPGTHACSEARVLAERKLTLIERKMADLAAMRQALAGLVQQFDAGGARASCPIIDVLACD